jgi:Uma2 family endonuclease
MSQAAATKAEGRRRAAIVIEENICIPGWVVDHESFRRWARSADFPDRGRFSFLDGEIWVDLSMEELCSHNQVKGEYAVVLGSLVKAQQTGLFIHDRMLLSNAMAGLSSEPDGAFASWETLRTRKIQLVEGVTGGYVELEGTPDMVLEIVSDSSVRKDTVILFRGYWRAGIREFWLVDVRRGTRRFDIFRHQTHGYVAAKKHRGWLKSAVFGKSFQLTEQTNPLGYPQYTLAVR